MTNTIKKIKITTILFLFAIMTQIFFESYIGAYSMLVFISLYFIFLIYLTIQSFKIGGLIKKLTLWLDIVAILVFATSFIPITQETYIIGKLIPNFLLFISAIGLTVVILINSYIKKY